MNDGFSAIADPTRRRIIALLAEGDQTVKGIAAQFDISRPAISKHLRILRETGIVLEAKQGREHIQCLNVAGLQPVIDWVNRYESFWQAKLATLKNLVEED